MTSPLYEHIEFCRGAQTLWGKLKTGRWDWLGVHPDGRFVLGSPPVGRVKGRAALEVLRTGISEKRFGAVVHEPEGFAGAAWCGSAEEARREFQQYLDRLEATDKPTIYRVRCIIDGEVAEEEFVVLRPPTYR